MRLALREVGGGALLAALGAVAVVASRTNDFGTLTHMGAGFMPTVLGGLLIVIGAAVALSGATLADAGVEAVELPDLRGCAAIIGGLVAFLVFGTYTGLLPATFVCVFIAAIGDRTATWRGALGLACVVTAGGLFLFSYLLRVPFPLIRW